MLFFEKRSGTPNAHLRERENTHDANKNERTTHLQVNVVDIEDVLESVGGVRQ